MVGAPAMKRDRSTASRVLMLVALTMIVGSCGGASGVGLFGDFNGKLDIETDDVRASREAARVIVEQGHRGQLEKEDTSFPAKLFGMIGRDAEAVMTFRVPAAQFDATLVDLDTAGVGNVVSREVRGRDDIERRSDLSEVSQILNERLTEIADGNSADASVIDAQDTLEDLAEAANFPVLVVQLHPGRGFFDWTIWLIFNRVLWVAFGVIGGFIWGRRGSSLDPSPVLGPDDPRQNSPEKNPGVQDRGSTT